MSDGASSGPDAIRARLAAARGPEYWRTLEELAGTPEFRELLHREFPREASVWDDLEGRRRFLALMGASLALAGLHGCSRKPAERIVPHVRAPEEFLPGKPLFYATALTLGGIALGVLVRSHQGRPTKVEGNPAHPDSLGATDLYAQAAILSLYDPDRAQAVTHRGRISTPAAFLEALKPALELHRSRKGAGLRILTGAVASPTLAAQLAGLLEELPEARWHAWEPAGRESAAAGARLAFGRDAHPVHSFDRADVILSFDSDFLSCGPGHVRAAREFASRRSVEGGRKSPNRLYVAESMPSATGAVADHRLAVRSVEMEALARDVAASVISGEGRGWAGAVGRDLRGRRGSSLVVAGEGQSPVVHALVHGMNHELGNGGRTVRFIDPPWAQPPDGADSLRALVADMKDGRVESLVILGADPVYDAPADLEFARHLSSVKLRIRLGLYEDETSALCDWHLPESHELESWSDARGSDGTVTILQPLIAPLYGGRTAHEMLSILRGRPDRAAHEIVRDTWKAGRPGPGFEEFWQTALHEGTVAGSAFPAVAVAPRPALREVLSAPGPRPVSGLEIVFRPDPTVHDGRFANNGWLQELPKPITKLTWDNAALIAPATAARLALESGEIVELRQAGRSLRAPVWIVPGHAEDSVTLHLGYGRARAGRVGTGAGVSAFALRTSGALGFAPGLQIAKTGEFRRLAVTQHHHLIDAEHPVRSATVKEFEKDPSAVGSREPSRAASLYPPWPAEGPAWGMAIDLNACTGCNACVAACQSENNIPVVGREEVLRGREMHWLRIDTYRRGAPENPETFFQPMLCQHCENAPCEVVCPVAATTHSAEGLNEMTYNRCVGTRYCSNNCPYKVRRFNFFQYSDLETPALQLLRNPEVTVRSRGVMEKCSYCVQRISAARIEAKKEDRPVREGDVVTACQAVCPARAIVFGDVADRGSRVARLKESPLNYAVLGELNVRPRTTYLARLRNPNPELEGT